MNPRSSELSWLGIFRLGLVQAALGAIVVLVTSTLNRVMQVEYGLPAMLPGGLVALHYAVQLLRPRFGYGSDRGGHRTRWILGGIGVLGVGGILCGVATVTIASHPLPALALAIVAYAIVGLGVGAAGTSLLVLLANQVGENRRAAAATIMWVLMIAGFAVTSTIVSHFLDPFSPRRLLEVLTTAACVAFSIALAGVLGVEKREAEPRSGRVQRRADSGHKFGSAVRQVWAEPAARGFTIFVFISMLAYSGQELLMEPFAGLVFGLSVGASAALSGLQHAAVLLGMVGVGIACSGRRRFGSLRLWTVGGCIASAVALLSLVGANLTAPAWPLRASVFALGLSNGIFAVASIGSMMALAHKGSAGNPGVRMGLWGAAQALAFALGGFCSTTLVDSVRYFSGSPSVAFGIVFFAEAALFLLAARLAVRVRHSDVRPPINLNAGAVRA